MTAQLTEQAMTLRCLTVDELPLCLPFGYQFYDEMRLPGSFVPEAFLQNWTTFLTPPHVGDIIALWKGEELIGALGTLLAPDPNDWRLTASEFFWYIHKEHRRGTGALRLLRSFEDWGIEKGAFECRLVHLLTEGETESPHSIKLAKLYRKLGYRPIEVGWIKTLPKREGESLWPS